MLPFSIRSLYTVRLLCCALLLLIWFQMKSLLSYLSARAEACKFQRCVGWREHSVANFPASGKLEPDSHTLLHSNSNLMRVCLQLSLRLFVRVRWDCAVVITRQFKPSVERGRQCARCSLSQWVEMNNSTMSVWVPVASQDLIVFECTWHGLSSQCLFVTWPLAASTHAAVCEIGYSCSVTPLGLQVC